MSPTLSLTASMHLSQKCQAWQETCVYPLHVKLLDASEIHREILGPPFNAKLNLGAPLTDGGSCLAGMPLARIQDC